MNTKSSGILAMYLLCASVITAQHSSLFGEQNTSWMLTYEDFIGKHVDSCAIVGDTIITAESYRKVSCYFNGVIVETTFGFVREDTTSGKAWAISRYDQEERLILDLGLTMEDSFFVSSVWWSGGIWAQVDTIYAANNRKIIEFDLEIPWASNETFKMIEGIGTNMGIFYQNPGGVNFGPYLLCAYKDHIRVYTNDNPLYQGQCSLISSAIASPLSPIEQLVVFPNPTADQITISRDFQLPGSTVHISIIDLAGKVRYLKEHRNNQIITIDVSNLESGLYFVKIY